MVDSGQAPPSFSRLAGSDYLVRELAAMVDQPQNLVSYHLDLDHRANAPTATGAALHPALRPSGATPSVGGMRIAVLFVCIGNGARGTMTRLRFDHVITLCDKAREVCPELATTHHKEIQP
jgi:hypothetical protein